jgi:hypothetical protein
MVVIRRKRIWDKRLERVKWYNKTTVIAIIGTASSAEDETAFHKILRKLQGVNSRDVKVAKNRIKKELAQVRYRDQKRKEWVRNLLEYPEILNFVF